MANANQDNSSRASEGEGGKSSQAAFEHAAERLKTEPDFEAYVAAIRASLNVGEYQFCRDAAEQLVKRWPDDDRSWQAAVRAWEVSGVFEQAVERLREQIAKPSSTHALEVLLADLLERTHQLEEADAILAHGESTPETDDYALLVTGRIRRRQGRLDEAIYLLSRIRPNTDTEGWVVLAAGYELARCCDQVGRFQEAFHAIGKTKQRQLKSLQPWVQRAMQFMKQHEQLATRLERKHITPRTEDLAQKRSNEEFPLVMLGGFPRSGTTLVESALVRHSALRSLEETPVFSQSVLNPLTELVRGSAGPIEILEAVTGDQLASCRSTYLRRGCEYLIEPFGEHRWIDKNPTLTPAAPFFLRAFPKTKFVFCIRDPRDVILSNCFLPVLETNSFNAFYFRLTDLAKWMKVHWECLKRFQEIAPDQVHLVTYEATVRDFESSLAKVFSFLNLPLEQSALSHSPHADERAVRSPTYADVARPLYQSAVGRWKNYADQLAPAMKILEPLIADWEALS